MLVLHPPFHFPQRFSPKNFHINSLYHDVSHLQPSGILVYPHKVPAYHARVIPPCTLHVRQTVHTIQHPCYHPLYSIGGSVFSALLQMAIIKQWNSSQFRLYFRQDFVCSTEYSSLLSVSLTTNNPSPPTPQRFRAQRPPQRLGRTAGFALLLKCPLLPVASAS